MTAGNASITRQARRPAITAASILCLIFGVGWPVAMAPDILYMVNQRALRTINMPFGQIRALAGPFEAFGMDAMILLAVLFAILNLGFIPAGYRLWKSQRKGGRLAAGLLGGSALFWYGFALPIPPFIGVLLAGLLAAGWKSLREG